MRILPTVCRAMSRTCYAALTALAVTGCATKALRSASPAEWTEASRPGVVDGRGPGLAARQWLQREGLEHGWKSDPEDAFAALWPHLAAADARAARRIAGELCLDAGRRAKTDAGRRGWALAAAAHAHAAMTAGRDTAAVDRLAPDLRNAVEIYNAALADYLVALGGALPGDETLPACGLAFRVDASAVRCAGVTNLDPARVRAPRETAQINRRYGVGAAVTIAVQAGSLVPDREPWHPAVRVLPVRPATLLARFMPAADGTNVAVALTLHDPIESPVARLGEVEVPLEADLAVPLANEILRDPVLSSRVQIWAFFYATVNPIAQSASELRHSIEALRAQVDPDGADAAWDRMVLVGHSMGGLISRLLVSHGTIEPSPEIAAAIETLPPDRRAYFEDLGRLEPLSCVRRAVLLGAPNRGAEMASSLVGRLGNALISLPAATIDFLGPGTSSGVKPVAAPTGIRNLRPESAFIRSLSGVPLPAEVPVHTIAADLREAGRTGGTDGVVPYASAHLDGAASELVVRSDHLSMHKEPPAIQEVLRILRLHAGPGIKDGG